MHETAIFSAALEFHWGIVTRDGVFEGSKLHMEPIAARLECTACARECETASRVPA